MLSNFQAWRTWKAWSCWSFREVLRIRQAWEDCQNCQAAFHCRRFQSQRWSIHQIWRTVRIFKCCIWVSYKICWCSLILVIWGTWWSWKQHVAPRFDLLVTWPIWQAWNTYTSPILNLWRTSTLGWADGLDAFEYHELQQSPWNSNLAESHKFDAFVPWRAPSWTNPRYWTLGEAAATEVSSVEFEKPPEFEVAHRIEAFRCILHTSV